MALLGLMSGRPSSFDGMRRVSRIELGSNRLVLVQRGQIEDEVVR